MWKKSLMIGGVVVVMLALVEMASAQRAPAKQPAPAPTVLAPAPKGGPGASPAKPMVDVGVLLERIKTLEARVSQLEAKGGQQAGHRHDYEDGFVSGNQWMSLGSLRHYVNKDSSNLDGYGVYLRSGPLLAGQKGSTDRVTGPPR